MRVMPPKGGRPCEFHAWLFCFAERINKMDTMNRASGASDIEGKAATGSGDKGRSRVSFKTSDVSDSVNSIHSVRESLPNSTKVYVSGAMHKDVQVPFREITLAPTKSINGKIEVNEPVRVYDTSGPWGDPDFHGDATQGLPPLRAKWIRERGDVEEYEGRKVQPIDDGFLSESHAAHTSRKRSTLNAQHPTSNGAGAPLRRKPFRAKSHPVTQLWYARQGIITPEMEFIAIRENLGREQLQIANCKSQIERNDLEFRHP